MERKQNYEIIKHFGVIRTNDRGETLEVNLVSWFGREPKIDIRYWNHDKGSMGKGLSITLNEYHDLVTKLSEVEVSLDE